MDAFFNPSKNWTFQILIFSYFCQRYSKHENSTYLGKWELENSSPISKLVTGAQNRAIFAHSACFLDMCEKVYQMISMS